MQASTAKRADVARWIEETICYELEDEPNEFAPLLEYDSYRQEFYIAPRFEGLFKQHIDQALPPADEFGEIVDPNNYEALVRPLLDELPRLETAQVCEAGQMALTFTESAITAEPERPADLSPAATLIGVHYDVQNGIHIQRCATAARARMRARAIHLSTGHNVTVDRVTAYHDPAAWRMSVAYHQHIYSTGGKCALNGRGKQKSWGEF